MTEAEKDILRQLKERTVSELRALDLSSYAYALEDTDARLLEYVRANIDNPDDHNLYELLGVKRFFYLLDRFEWKQKRVKAYFIFYECLKFNGAKGRTRYRLTPVQCFQFANIFGFVDEQGRRLIRDAYLFVPRKYSKTTSSASLAVFELLYGESNAQAYVGANSFGQAKICFNEIRAIMRGLDPDEVTFRINRENIFYKRGARDSSVRCLAANPRTLDGLNASLVIMDEYAQARDTSGKGGADLKNVLTSSMGARKEPLTIVITTASDVIDGPFVHELDGVKKVLRGEAVNNNVFASLFMPDVDDREDDPHTWAKVQPHLGITVQTDYYEKEWQRAQLSAENMLTFRTKLLNIFAINEQKCWISPEIAKKASISLNPKEIEGRPEAMVSFDLSESGDFTAVSVTIYDRLKKCFFIHTAYFFPEGALAEHPNRALYRKWAADGWLRLCDGPVIDYQAIVNYILELSENLSIVNIGFDNWKAKDVINLLRVSGGRGGERALKPVPQTYGYFTSPCQTFEHGIKTGGIFIDDNPINAYCFANAILDTDKLENCKPIKRQATQRIDGLITMLMGIWLWIDRK